MHAYLIMAHNDFSILKKTLLLLDDKNNEFYIHIDKKVKNFDFDYFQNLLKYSRIHFIKRRNIQWGSYNIIRTEMDLFKAAYKNNYDVYHLISGSDMPIVSKESIKEFFDCHPDTEFIDIMRGEKLSCLNDRTERFRYYHFFNNYGINKFGMRRLDNLFVKIQKKLNVDRFKDEFEYAFGSEWVSLSRKGVEALTKNEKWIKKHFRYTHCCDEIYKQTVFIKENLKVYKGNIPNMRLIMWGKNDDSCHPDVLRTSDFDNIKKSGCLFARKFSSEIDMEIVEMLYQSIIHN